MFNRIIVSQNIMSFNSPGRLFEDAEDWLEADIWATHYH